MSEEKSAQIAELNDRFRRCFGMPGRKAGSAVPGQVVSTRSIATLPSVIQVQIWNAVIGFDDFSEDNDPHGEHDFGAFEIDGTDRFFWKIDYYADASCKFGSEDPSDITRCYRVLTIMRAEEY